MNRKGTLGKALMVLVRTSNAACALIGSVSCGITPEAGRRAAGGRARAWRVSIIAVGQLDGPSTFEKGQGETWNSPRRLPEIRAGAHVAGDDKGSAYLRLAPGQDLQAQDAAGQDRFAESALIRCFRPKQPSSPQAHNQKREVKCIWSLPLSMGSDEAGCTGRKRACD